MSYLPARRPGSEIETRPRARTITDRGLGMRATMRCGRPSVETIVRRIATNAGQATVRGLSAPPRPIVNVAGTRTLAAPPVPGVELVGLRLVPWPPGGASAEDVVPEATPGERVCVALLLAASAFAAGNALELLCDRV
jgi:hypothetical protein